MKFETVIFGSVVFCRGHDHLTQIFPPPSHPFRFFLRLAGILSRHVAIFGEVLGIFLVYDIHDLCYFHIIAELLLVAKQSLFVFLLFFPSLVSIYEVHLSVCWAEFKPGNYHLFRVEVSFFSVSAHTWHIYASSIAVVHLAHHNGRFPRCRCRAHTSHSSYISYISYILSLFGNFCYILLYIDIYSYILLYFKIFLWNEFIMVIFSSLK